MKRLLLPAVCLGLLSGPCADAFAHDPLRKFHDDIGLLSRWVFTPENVGSDQITSSTDDAIARFTGDMKIVTLPDGAALLSEGMNGIGTITTTTAGGAHRLPTRAMTVSAWVNVRQPTRWGGVMGIIQDNGDAETGWVLGYSDDHFSFALSTTGADDGDGKMTYLVAEDSFESSRWYHVAATYDGSTMRLYVNGALAGSSTEQSGDILYPDSAPFVLGCYRDANEHHPLEGGLQHIRLYNRCLDQPAIERSLVADPSLKDAAAIHIPLRMLVQPYLQASTKTSMTVMFETNEPGTGTIEYGPSYPLQHSVTHISQAGMYEVPLADLQPETQYFYRVRAESESGEAVSAGDFTFKTAVNDDSAFAFIVMGDTQNNPRVTKAVSEYAWRHRPNFLIHCGDLVGTGEIKREWVYEFFGSASDLLCRFPLFPTLGNHERDAQLYYDYFSLPDPEYYYDYTYGNAHFFVLDTNKDVSPESDQYQWLKKRLAESDATWKIVYHHQPAFTSDENDYGDTYEGGSTQGDPNIQQHLVPLYEEFGVDVVFNGHIHVYERTWPLRGGRVDPENGVVYVTTGGAGGGLEDFAPTRTWFNAHMYRGHHYLVVAMHGGVLSMKAYDIEGRMFDFMELRKEK